MFDKRMKQNKTKKMVIPRLKERETRAPKLKTGKNKTESRNFNNNNNNN